MSMQNELKTPDRVKLRDLVFGGQVATPDQILIRFHKILQSHLGLKEKSAPFQLKWVLICLETETLEDK
jgi:hypothetical protein